MSTEDNVMMSEETTTTTPTTTPTKQSKQTKKATPKVPKPQANQGVNQTVPQEVPLNPQNASANGQSNVSALSSMLSGVSFKASNTNLPTTRVQRKTKTELEIAKKLSIKMSCGIGVKSIQDNISRATKKKAIYLKEIQECLNNQDLLSIISVIDDLVVPAKIVKALKESKTKAKTKGGTKPKHKMTIKEEFHLIKSEIMISLQSVFSNDDVFVIDLQPIHQVITFVSSYSTESNVDETYHQTISSMIDNITVSTDLLKSILLYFQGKYHSVTMERLNSTSIRSYAASISKSESCIRSKINYFHLISLFPALVHLKLESSEVLRFKTHFEQITHTSDPELYKLLKRESKTTKILFPKQDVDVCPIMPNETIQDEKDSDVDDYLMLDESDDDYDDNIEA